MGLFALRSAPSDEVREDFDRCPDCREESEARDKLRASLRRVAARAVLPAFATSVAVAVP